MSSVESFAQDALRNHIAPPSIGSVKARLRHASRRMKWKQSRVRDAWYADSSRISISGEELSQIEETTGLRYARKELRTNDELIAKAASLLEGVDPDFHGPFVAGLVAFARALASARTEGGQ